MKEIVPGLWDIDEIGPSVHVYLWQWAEGATLIDMGLPGNADKILAAARSLGYAPKDIKRLIVTHADIDHVGSLNELKQATGAPIGCHAVEKELLEHPERRLPSKTLSGYAIRPLFMLARLVPSLRIEPITPDELYLDGERLPEGFVVIHTPGHTPGHISLLHPEMRFLIAGDALNTRGGTLAGPPAIFTPDMDSARQTIWKLWKKHGIDYDAIAFGHGEPIRQEAAQVLQGLVEQLFETTSGPKP